MPMAVSNYILIKLLAQYSNDSALKSYINSWKSEVKLHFPNVLKVSPHNAHFGFL